MSTGLNFPYPVTPTGVPASVTEPSPSFKKEVSRVMGSVVLFFIVYIIMILLAAGLVAATVYGGIALIIAAPRILTIFIGIGLIGLGVMVFFFLIKFIFAVARFDRSGSIEITEAEQPKLFAFIRQLTADTQTPFPKRIYLSPEVNACVFYDSNFFSMFFPVKKNLQIGLGLVNAVNLGEFKAVMAHEFGHFSQRSMKLGSFVYNVNRVIFNMLYENTGYGGALQGWANLDGVFAIFASITVGIVRGIQFILRGMYSFINKSYMRLSREMEFHADAVAASVSGGRNLSSALHRIEFADSGYQLVLQKCNELLREKKRSRNIYANHRTVLQHFAEEFKLPVIQGLPELNKEFMQSRNYNRVNFKDQWASHPSTEDREQHLEALGVEAEINHSSAWVLFENAEQWQEKLTTKIYENVADDKDTEWLDEQGFTNRYAADNTLFSFAEAYHGFYNGRQVALMDDMELNKSVNTSALRFEDLFTPENGQLFKKLNAAKYDLEVLKAILEKKIEARSFDFDGTKYDRKQAPELIAKLEAEIRLQEEKLTALDKNVVHYFLNKAAEQGELKAAELKAAYQQYFSDRRKADHYLQQLNTALEGLQPLYQGNVTLDNVQSIISNLKTVHEPKIKSALREWSEKGAFDKSTILKEKVNRFLSSDHAYFSGTEFYNDQLNELQNLATESWEAVNEFLFLKFKKVTETGLEICAE